ncbi:MAG: type II toxin-antitoxin system RelE/ParE family toxin [Rhodospirillaceae bacterium]|nr:type II toxin-antitoxin system RelE/ParE family toxin [Rhodospirillaceae bacterium]MBT4042027.1 type II toxin-antitoxin system RelE/ParE family toxin [Rhodospirillaceae bacterium]MBT4690341.1 type II toxin-antitoxin system RelE/ParE family toxin [Rhodospirillaceae bacterium]MBT5079299.1 type II toxin-antitoxin system RelE/ParE family toxin [Rhodospirillaceae bacterium]MBT5525775.1 type II toxin-antitoxin system RelE/ParE family toxin [Rhodospirillaceae bacterium]
MRYSLSEASIGDIEGIYRYTLTQFGTAQAVANHGSLEQAFERICEYPQIGRQRPEIDELTRSLVHRSHTIYYEIRADHIFILRILHGQQDPMRHQIR